MNDLEDALLRFGELEQRELLTGIAQVSRDTNLLKDDTKEIKAIVKEIVAKMSARDWGEVLPKLKGWLSPPDPSTNYNIGLRDLHEETATWFLEGRIFQEWRSTGSLLWIHGKPGSGKSILCSAIIQRIISLCEGRRASVAYFYFDFRDNNKKHRHNLLPSLLVQFAAHSIPCCNIISRVYSAYGNGTQQPSDEVMINCLTNMLSAMTQQPIYVIVDAIDESPNTTGVRSPRERVLGLINNLVNLRLPNLHICISSRPEVDIRNRLERLTSHRVSLHDQTEHMEDIAKYISSEVNFIANDNSWPDDDKELVIETLSEKADGMFRWVFCQLEMLRLCLPSRVRHFLNNLPKTLDETYERILKGIHEANRSHAQRLLQCLAVAIRPLRVDELAEILFSDPDASEGEVPIYRRSNAQERELLSTCPGLITITDSDGSRVVQFSHFSVLEFLTSGRLSTSSENISCYHILPDDAHTTLAQASLGVLLRLDDGCSRKNAMKIPLAEYAARYWVSHTQVGSVLSRVMLPMKTLFDSTKFEVWLKIYDIDGLLRRYSPARNANYSKPLYYSALYGFYDLTEYFVKKHPQLLNNAGGAHDYPLVVALHRGHIRVAELLFEHGADVEVQGRFADTPLHRAIEWSDDVAVGAVRFLLEHGADVNARQKDFLTPLHLAAARGYFEVAQMLLQHRVDVNPRNVVGETPLHLVSKRAFPRSEDTGSCLDLVQLLLKHGAEVDSRDGKDATALHNASLMRDPEVVRVLLNHGAYVKAEDNQSRTPLHQLLEPGDYSGADRFGFVSKKKEDRFGITQLLLERGADVNARDKGHETPLHLACHLPEVRLARILLEHGANASVNAADYQGRTPLHRVLWAGDRPDADRFGVAQLLIERGADVNARDKYHQTPLHPASYFVELKFVRILLDHGANVNTEGNQGLTPLHRVWRAKGHPDKDRFGVAQLLIERGADVNARDQDHETPLHLASRLVSLDGTWILLKYGAHLNAENLECKTPFQLAREGIREEMKNWPSDDSIGRSWRAKCVALMGLLYG
ncbi:ankyrin repeat-containing domain protein [Lactarius deliciosus]|nr:ankyrin repeat-containing domain protein [Lactarius deliciosus]